MFHSFNFILLLPQLLLLLPTESKRFEKDIEFQDVVQSSNPDQSKIFHATVEIMSSHMLNDPRHPQFNQELSDEKAIKRGELNPSIKDHLKSVLLPENNEKDKIEIPNISEIVKTKPNFRHYPSVFGIGTNQSHYENLFNELQLNTQLNSHSIKHSHSVHSRINSENNNTNNQLKQFKADLPLNDIPHSSNIIGRSQNILHFSGLLPLNSNNLNQTIIQNKSRDKRTLKEEKDISSSLVTNALSAEGMEIFAKHVSERTLRLVMEENHVAVVRDHHGKDIGVKQESTFFIMSILKLIISPFVCLIMMVVITPAEGGMKNEGGPGITQAAGTPLVQMLGKIIGFVLGIILAWILGNVITEACTFLLTVKLTFVVCNNIFERTAMETVDTLSQFFMHTLLPALQIEVVGYLVDILSDALHSSLHHTITRVMSTRLSKSLTPATLHYYYCVYCYYYGDYCNQCFHNSEDSIIDMLTWTNFGS
eukprot:c18415_g1_i1.p1 GENE.c18415_g1_i1~~c18415_g1_i1.p1  ORF type:complete len:479 (+),score=171.45 c18415_g1_i1:30-1466(+)